MSKMYVGIDPGKQGGIAVIDTAGNLETTPTPLMHRSYDLDGMARLLLPHEGCSDVIVALEKQQSYKRDTPMTAFSVGYGYGLWQMLLAVYEIPHQVVDPKEGWQLTIFEGLTKAQKKDTKKAAHIVARRLWPKHEWRASAQTKSGLSKNPHDGMIDAALIAEYGRRMNL